ncbi:hypothetical protein BGW39_010888 [Mortierella sp. 14UC]|nr:hypothetical protein BGW39_010888 [Mortierella sp. 14UC]
MTFPLPSSSLGSSTLTTRKKKSLLAAFTNTAVAVAVTAMFLGTTMTSVATCKLSQVIQFQENGAIYFLQFIQFQALQALQENLVMMGNPVLQFIQFQESQVFQTIQVLQENLVIMGNQIIQILQVP